MRAISHIWDRLEGNPASNTDLTSGGEKLVLNLVQYGVDHTPQLPTEAVAVGVPESTPEIQGGVWHRRAGKSKDSPERTDTQNPV